MSFLAIDIGPKNIKQLEDKKQSEKPCHMLEIIQLKYIEKSIRPPSKKRKKKHNNTTDNTTDGQIDFPWDNESDPIIEEGNFQPRQRK